MRRSPALAAAAALAAALFAAPAAAEGFYLSGSAGVAPQKDGSRRTAPASAVVSVAAGHSWDVLSLEAALTSWNVGGSGGSQRIDLHGIGLAALVHPWRIGRVQPYGYAAVHFVRWGGAGAFTDHGRTGLLYTVGIGARVEVAPRWSLDLRAARLLSDSNLAVRDNGGFDSLRSWDLRAGVVYRFGGGRP